MNKLEIHCCGQIFWSIWLYKLHTKISLVHNYTKLELMKVNDDKRTSK